MKRYLFIIPVLALVFFSAVFADSSTDTDFNLNIDSVLSLTANVSEVPINITPTPAGAFSHK